MNILEGFSPLGPSSNINFNSQSCIYGKILAGNRKTLIEGEKEAIEKGSFQLEQLFVITGLELRHLGTEQDTMSTSLQSVYLIRS